MRGFNTAGPVRADMHYCIPPLERPTLAEVLALVRRERYFVLHAPRQTGKTSALLALRNLLNGGSEGDYRCAYVNVEPAQTAREDVGRAIGTIVDRMGTEARHTLGDEATAEAAGAIDTTIRPDNALAAFLAKWSAADPRPLVLLIDEIDALVGELCFEHQALRLRDRPLSEADVFAAREALILRRDTHIDQLADKLREPRVRRVIEPLLSGGDAEYSDRDREYVRDLGLVAPDAPLRIANPIYAEVVPRELTWVLQDEIPRRTASYVDADGCLDLDKLLGAFQEFFRENSEHWIKRAQYTEAGPQLVLQAFLHRVVNATGRIEREYALGSRRVDLLVVWPRGTGRADRFVVECKLLRRGPERTIERGLEQTAAYMDISGADAGHLVIFDMREGRSWDERIFRERRTAPGGKRITVWGM